MFRHRFNYIFGTTSLDQSMHHCSANGLVLAGEPRAPPGHRRGGCRPAPRDPRPARARLRAPQNQLDRFSPSSVYSEHPSTPYDLASAVVLSVLPPSKMYLKNFSNTNYCRARSPRAACNTHTLIFKIVSKPITVFDQFFFLP